MDSGSGVGGRKKRVSSRDVAGAAHVSVNTVSLVVRDSPLVAPETKARVRAVIDRLGYQPNAAAAALRSARTVTLGYVMVEHRGIDGEEIESVADIFGTQLLRAVIKRAQQSSYHILTTFVDSLALVDSGRIDGALCSWQVGDAVLMQLATRRVPVVVVGRDAGNIPVSWVKADEEGGAYEAVRHLLALGHRRFGLIDVSEAHSSCIARERVRGFLRGLTEAGITIEPRCHPQGDWTFQSGYDLATALLTHNPRPTALFILSEILSAGALRAIVDLGLRVPDDVAIATTEDSPIVDYVWPRLTAVHVPMYQVGLRATELLLSMLDRPSDPPRHLVLPTRLEVRESTVPRGMSDLVPTAQPDGQPHPITLTKGGADTLI